MTGTLLDLEAERMVKQLYVRDSHGVIIGAQTIQPQTVTNPQAIVFLHGFADTPQVFAKTIERLKTKINADIYAPLLPFHGRDLHTFQALDNQKVMQFIKIELNQLGKKYQRVIVVAHSYSGLMLSQLLVQHQLRPTIQPILYAPANYILLNTPLNILKNHLYGLWRNYCNYEMLGCARSFRTSDDPQAQLSEISLQYKVLPAIHALFAFDRATRNNIQKISQPFKVIIAKDDSRVDFQSIAQACQANRKYCKLSIFQSGKHMPHYGKTKAQFEQLIIDLVHEQDP